MSKFPISSWTYMPLTRVWDNFVKDHYDMGINVLMTPWFSEGDDPAVMVKILDECQELGMKALVHDERVVIHRQEPPVDEAEYRARFQKTLDDFGGHPAVLGFYVGDEPDAPDAANFFKVARIQREMAPNLLPYLNLLPWFDWIAERIGSPAYGPYLDRAVKEGNLAFLSYDCYTNATGKDSDYDVYFNNLREMRDASERNGVPFHSIVLGSGHFHYPCPTQEDMRWQISTVAALGAKAISHFCVVAGDRLDNRRYFPINHWNERTLAFQWMSEENRFFQDKHGELLMQLKCIKSEFTLKAYGGLGMFEPDDTLLAAHNKQDVNMLVSTFIGPNGTKYRAVVNLDRKKDMQARLAFAPGVKVKKMGWNNQWMDCAGYVDAVSARSADGATASMWMAAGQMEIIKEF